MPEKDQIKTMYKNKKYSEIVELCKQPDEYNKLDEYEFNYFLLSLNKLERCDECLQEYKVFKDRFKNSELGDYAACSSLYNKTFKDCDVATCDLNLMKKQLDFIIKHDKDKTAVYSMTWPAIKSMLNVVKKRITQSEPEAELEILNKINPKELSTLCSTGERDGKPIEFASPQEDCFSRKIDALLAAGKYNECMECVDEAYRVITKFHYNNDVWFNKKKAKALVRIQRMDEAGDILIKLTTKLQNEWLYKDLFDIEVITGNSDMAMFYGCQCALLGEKSDSISGFSNQFAVFLKKQGKEEMAMLERQLAICILKEKKEQIKPVDGQLEPNEEIAAMNKRQVIGKLKPMWFEVIDSHKEYLHGTIISVNSEKKLGNILGPDGTKYFFKFREVRSRYSEIQTGRKVKFSLEERYDPVKGKYDTNAVSITVFQ